VWITRSLAPLVAPALLLGVAGVQIHQARTAHLSPWKGGGFGMFSTTDVVANRTLRAYARLGGTVREVPIPAALEDEAERARVLPSPRILRGLARALSETVPAKRFRFELWRQRFEPGTLAPHPTLVHHLEIDLAAEADR